MSGAVPTADVAECGGATAVNGQPLAFTVGDAVMINDATVSIADVDTSNGVIHVIDKVLLQPIHQTTLPEPHPVLAHTLPWLQL